MNYGTLQRDDEEAKDPSSWQNLRLKEETEKQRDDWRWEFRLSSLSKRERRNQQQRIYLIGICSLLMILLFPLSVIILLSGIQNNEDCLVPEISFGERYEDYDYIVVGGGPSGILVASKLARKLENTSARVLLLESGTTSQSSVVENLENMERTNVSPPPTGLAWAGGQGAQQAREQQAAAKNSKFERPAATSADPEKRSCSTANLALRQKKHGL